MQRSSSKLCVIVGSAVVLGMVCHLARADESPKAQKALIQFDRLLPKWKKDAPSATSAANQQAEAAALGATPLPHPSLVMGLSQIDPLPSYRTATEFLPPQPAAAPPQIANAQVAPPPAARQPIVSQPVAAIEQVTNEQPVVRELGEPAVEASPIPTTVPGSALSQAQQLASQLQQQGGQAPVILVVPQGGEVNFAPRQLSPEVSEEFWPLEARNPLGRRERRGVFQWPSSEKSSESGSPQAQLATSTPREQSVPQPTPQTSSKALFSLPQFKETVTAPAKPLIDLAQSQATAPQSAAKPLFNLAAPQPTVESTAPSRALLAPSAPQAAAATPPANQSRALLGPAAPQAAATPPANPSRALFAFMQKTPAATPTPASETPTLPRAEEPAVPLPMPPMLEDVRNSEPETITVGDLKWRTKGSPRATLVTAQEPAAATRTEAATSESTTHQPNREQQGVAASNNPPPASSQRAAQHSPAASSSGKKPRALFAGPQAGGHTAAGMSESATETPPEEEKAIVPELLSRVSRVIGAISDEDQPATRTRAATSESNVAPAAHLAADVDPASRRSYYAPPVHPGHQELARRTQSASEPASSRRRQDRPERMPSSKTARVETVDLSEDDDDELLSDLEEVVSEELAAPATRRTLPAAGTTSLADSKMRPTAPPTPPKRYRKWRLQDLTDGFLRPWQVFNQATKLPGTRRMPEEVESHDTPRRSRVQVAAQQPPKKYEVVELQTVEAAAETAIYPDIEAETVARVKKVEPPALRIARAENDSARHDLSDSGKQIAPRPILRTGRRQVGVPLVALDEVGEESTAGLEAMQIRNRSGSRVVIFTPQTDQQDETAMEPGARNPLR